MDVSASVAFAACCAGSFCGLALPLLLLLLLLLFFVSAEHYEGTSPAEAFQSHGLRRDALRTEDVLHAPLFEASLLCSQ